VALMLAQQALIGWEPVNSSIIKSKLTTKRKDIKVKIIQCHDSTNDAKEEKNDQFYRQLQE
jgi:ribosomal protein L21